MERRWSFHPSMNVTVELNQMPDVHGHFGPYGGVFVPETLMPAIQELTEEYERARRDPKFRLELDGPPELVLWTADASLLCRATQRTAPGAANLSQEGGPFAHGRSQNQ